ncbi:MAG: YicC/YloC family endoribonuclease [Chitinophagales bacterium]
MVLSMTGYGRKTFSLNGKNIVLELKTLNSKTFDLNLRLAPLFKEFEIEIRNLLNKTIIRGKTDCTLGFELMDDKNGEINASAIKEYYAQLKTIAAELKVEDANLLDIIFRLPNVTATSTDSISEEQWDELQKHIDEVCRQLVNFRVTEGSTLEEDLNLHVEQILNALNDVEALDPSRMEQQRHKLLSDLKTYISEGEIDKNRFEQEVIFYLEKMDITEEVIRLRSHCTYFKQTIEEQLTEKGKKLGFICQEMNREINTIGSKAYHAEMQRKVVIMKDELEKIKEQLNNVL